MINSIELSNFGPIKKLKWDSIQGINLIIGNNATGKTFLLKILYTLIRASEEFGRGNDPRKFEEVLADKLYWTFEVNKLSDLLSKGVKEKLSVKIKAMHGNCNFSFGESTVKSIIDIKNGFEQRASNSIFFPAKEVLSIIDIIKYSREQMKSFGFDDTYYDLAKALSIPKQKGKNYETFSKARGALEEIIQGSISFDQSSKEWSFIKGRFSYPISITSEGIKKISIIDNLLGNRYLTPDSVIYIDEPESALHPEALSKFLEIMYVLSSQGIQIFIASHSYFAVKKLLLIAKNKNISIPVVSLSENGYRIDDMKDGMPENSIIRESINMYKEEVEFSFNE